MKYSSIEDIYNRFKEIVDNPKNDSLDLLGSYIVVCTFVLDDIHEYYAKYPLLEEVAELDAELETIDDTVYQDILGELQELNKLNKKYLNYFYNGTEYIKSSLLDLSEYINIVSEPLRSMKTLKEHNPASFFKDRILNGLSE